MSGALATFHTARAMSDVSSTYDAGTMGIERARVVEVCSAGRVGAGYLVGERLVLTAGVGPGRVDVRPASTATWYPASPAWTAAAGGVALLAVDEGLAPAGGMRWGEVAGERPVPVVAMGFPPAQGRPDRYRDAEQFVGTAVAATAGRLVLAPAPANRLAGDGLRGAAVFAGAELVGVAVGGGHAAPVSTLAADPWFVAEVGAGDRLPLVTVRAAAGGFSIL